MEQLQEKVRENNPSLYRYRFYCFFVYEATFHVMQVGDFNARQEEILHLWAFIFGIPVLRHNYIIFYVM